ncbi:hypothetical protein Cgig2_018932 [Carnegiea gigantea]|uniref:Uncharacterized protein n=1 Tax=Carnegiea gigantea TaxID=171969 RepID=A0A9Q1K5L4_9CARY|nr:hypothetical protein Cgig2_018932 [Carnegiea gigantea]
MKNLMTQIMMTQIETECMLRHKGHGRLVTYYFQENGEPAKDSKLQTNLKINAQNSENHGEVDKMHTTGPVSFAKIYHKLVRKEIGYTSFNCSSLFRYFGHPFPPQARVLVMRAAWKIFRNYTSNLLAHEPPSHIRNPKVSPLLFLCHHRLKLYVLHSQGLSAFIHKFRQIEMEKQLPRG